MLHRLLQLAGLRPLLELNDNLTRDAAWRIILSYGAHKNMTRDELLQFRKTMMKTLHPDAGGDGDAAATFNRAIDLLTQTEPENVEQPVVNPESETPKAPPWATDQSDYHIAQENYTDVNFIRKTMYDLSDGEPREEINVVAFDGYTWRNRFSCYTSMNLLTELAQAMIIFNSHGAKRFATRAVFIQRGDQPDLWLIYSDRKLHDPPIKMDHASQSDIPAFLDRVQAS